MNYLMINSHPYEGSFNAAIIATLERRALEAGHAVVIIDLVNDKFNPVMTEEDLKLWSKGQYADPLVEQYQNEIEKAEVLVFSFPVWWGTMPAVLKGFCDKVLLPGWAYNQNEQGEMIGKLTDKKAIVITTMETPQKEYNEKYRNPVEGAFIQDTLQCCGIDVVGFMQIDQIVSGGSEYANEKLQERKRIIK